MTAGLRQSNLAVGNEVDVFIAPIPYNLLTMGLPDPSYDITSPAIAVADETIAVAATAVKLWEGQALIFSNEYATVTPAPPFIRQAVKITSTVELGGTSLPIVPAPVAIASGQIARTYDFVPIYSCESISVDVAGSTASGYNVGLDGWEDTYVVGRSWKIPISGFLDIDDPALSLLESVSSRIGRSAWVFMQIVSPTGRTFQGRASVSDFSYSHSAKELVKISFNFVGAGVLERDKFAA